MERSGTLKASLLYDPSVITQAREQRQWTKRELARQAGVPPMSVVRIENGASPSFDLVCSVCEALGIDPLSLIMDSRPVTEKAKPSEQKAALAPLETSSEEDNE